MESTIQWFNLPVQTSYNSRWVLRLIEVTVQSEEKEEVRKSGKGEEGEGRSHSQVRIRLGVIRID